MKRSLTAWAVVGAGLVPLATARAADPSPAEILKMADDAGTSYKDLTLESQMQVYEPNAQTPREAKFVTYTKGEKRLVRFTAPPDSKGMGMLVESRDTMYVYLPGFQKVRRMGTHAKGQSFMGSDVSNEDMAAQTLSGVYQPKLLGSEGNEWVLDLTQIPGKEAEFPHLKVWADKGHRAITRIEYFDEKGASVKTQLRKNFTRDEGPGEHYTPAEITFIDHRRNDHKTVLRLTGAKINQNLGDDVFSQRALLRGQ
jgi:outer membrane lipoprotein-sorting protein